MASPIAPPASFSTLLKDQSHTHRIRGWLVTKPQTNVNHGHLRNYAAAAAEGPNRQQKAPPGVDTRIHWENEDEGWIGGTKSKPTEEQLKAEQNLLGKKFSDLLNSSSDSHYQ